LLKISTSHCPDNLVVSITVARLRNTKTVAQALINVARYFGKIRKQLEEKEKKGREDKSMAAIRQFLAQFEERVDEQLYLVKNPAKLESIIADFKQKIGVLKNRIQNSTV
jgi:flagellar biosynthesis chaperone FliJ